MPQTRWRMLIGLVAGLGTAAMLVAGHYQPAEQSSVVGWAAAAIASLAGGGVAYFSVRRPWWGLLGWLAAMPIINLARAELWFGPFQIISTTPLALSLAAGVLLTAPWRPAGGGRTRTQTVTWGLVAAVPLLAVASTLVAPISRESINVTLHGLLEPMLVLAAVLALRPDARRGWQALGALAGGVTLASIINLGWMQLTLTGNDLYERRLLFARLTFWNVGLFGEMLVLALPALAALLLLRRRRGWPAWVDGAAWIAIGICLLGLFYTYTTSAWLAAALVVGLVIIALVRGLWRQAALLAATLVLLAVVVPYPSAILARVAPDLDAHYGQFVVSLQSEQRVASWDPETTEGSGSVEIRWVALFASAELVARHPLLGVGPTRYGPEFAAIRPSASVPHLASAHNLLPNLAAEYGLPLAIIFTLLLGIGVWGGIEALRGADADARVVGVTVAVMLIGFLAMGTLFGNDLYRTYRTVNSDVVVAGMLVGLGLGLRRRQAADEA